MTHLQHRAPGRNPTTWVSVGVRGERAAITVADARAYAEAQGVTFGSLLMEALAEYVSRRRADAKRAKSRANGHE